MVEVSLDVNGPAGWPGSGSPGPNELIIAIATVHKGRGSDPSASAFFISIFVNCAICFSSLIRSLLYKVG